MGRTKMMPAAAGILAAKLLRRKKPLIVGWAITDQCNRRCAYCSIWRRPNRDLPTPAVFGIIDALADAGTLRISFTGGEPLLRPDMPDIIRYVYAKGMETKLNSNGSLVKEKIDALPDLDMLTLSLEGPQKVHDAIRGPGSFDEVREALTAARARGIKTSLATVLTAINLETVDYILETAASEDCRVLFQPATTLRLGGQTANDLTPPVAAYREVIEKLIRRKKAGDRTIGNSVPGLKHLLRWPDPTRMRCASGWISCRIEPDGNVLYCSRESAGVAPKNCLTVPFQEAFDNLRPMTCVDCWCAGRVELNLAFSLNLPTMMNQLKVPIR